MRLTSLEVGKRHVKIATESIRLVQKSSTWGPGTWKTRLPARFTNHRVRVIVDITLIRVSLVGTL
jgi:hypothetical protein